MAQTTVSFRMDEETKNRFENLCDNLGMTMSTAFMIYVKQMLREDGMPFKITAKTETEKAMDEYDEMKAHPEKYKHYKSFSEAMDEVFSDA